MWVRINTSAFQESAVFSGKGAPKNNFLIELELQLERENDFLAGMYSENQLVFKRIIDSLKEEKRLLWKQLDSFNVQTTFAKDITRSATFILMLRAWNAMPYCVVPNGMQRKTVCFLTLEVP